MNILKWIALALAAFLSACEHGFIVNGFGHIVSASGERNCSHINGEAECRWVVTTAYTETFVAIPEPGQKTLRFEGCNTPNSFCVFNVPLAAVEQNAGKSFDSSKAFFVPAEAEDTGGTWRATLDIRGVVHDLICHSTQNFQLFCFNREPTKVAQPGGESGQGDKLRLRQGHMGMTLFGAPFTPEQKLSLTDGTGAVIDSDIVLTLIDAEFDLRVDDPFMEPGLLRNGNLSPRIGGGINIQVGADAGVLQLVYDPIYGIQEPIENFAGDYTLLSSINNTELGEAHVDAEGRGSFEYNGASGSAAILDLAISMFESGQIAGSYKAELSDELEFDRVVFPASDDNGQVKIYAAPDLASRGTFVSGLEAVSEDQSMARALHGALTYLAE